jgi:hypothetical protein
MMGSSTSVMLVNRARPPMIPWPEKPPSPAAHDQNRTALTPAHPGRSSMRCEVWMAFDENGYLEYCS